MSRAAHAQSSAAGADKAPGDVREEKDDDSEDEKADDGKPAKDKDKDKDQSVEMVDVVRAGLEPAYIAYPFGLSGLDRLIFESNVVAHFVVHQPSWPVAFVLVRSRSRRA